MDVVTWFQHSGTLTLLTFLRVRRKYICPRINITFISTLEWLITMKTPLLNSVRPSNVNKQQVDKIQEGRRTLNRPLSFRYKYSYVHQVVFRSNYLKRETQL